MDPQFLFRIPGLSRTLCTCILLDHPVHFRRVSDSPFGGDISRPIVEPKGVTMKHLTAVLAITALSLCILTQAYAQPKIGVGITVGEAVSIGLVPVPVYGASGFYAVTPSIHAGLQFGLLTGTSSGDSKAFDNVTAVEIAPYGKILFGGMKDIRPFFKLSIAFINYSVKLPGTNTTAGESRSESNSSLWGSFGLSYDVSKTFSLIGQVRFFDIGMSGKSKISYFGLASPAIGMEVYL